MPEPTTPTQVPDEVREHRARRFLSLVSTGNASFAKGGTISQTCQGDPDTCGCGGACPMLNAA